MVEDHRQIAFASQADLIAQDARLSIARTVIVVIIEARLADGDRDSFFEQRRKRFAKVRGRVFGYKGAGTPSPGRRPGRGSVQAA